MKITPRVFPRVVLESTIVEMMSCKIERTTTQPAIATIATALREQKVLVVVLVKGGGDTLI